MKTFCFKLYNSKRNKELHRQINAAGLIYNHCIALHRRYYKLYGKNLDKNQLQKHLIKINKKFYRYFQSRNIEGRIKTLTIKRDALGDIYIFI